MNKRHWMRWLVSSSDNRKSKIGNLKLVGLIALAVAFAWGGAVAQARQPGKIFRIGFLGNSTASGIAVLLEAFRQERSKQGGKTDWDHASIRTARAGE